MSRRDPGSGPATADDGGKPGAAARGPDARLEQTLAQRLEAAWQEAYGEPARVTALQALSSGASSSSWRFHLESRGQTGDCVLQTAGAGGAGAGALTRGGDTGLDISLDKGTQARVQQIAFQGGVPTPEVLLILPEDPDAPGATGAAGFVTRHTPGEALGGRVVHASHLAGARQELTGQCARALARIHALPVADFAFLPRRDAAGQTAELAALHRRVGAPRPAFEAAIAWLERHPPACRETVLVHGDFRTGNLLVDEDGLTGVLDWELAHLGDPFEDIGWLCMRSWRFGADDLPVGGFGRREDFYRAYTRACGREVDREAVAFWEMLSTLKWGVICEWFAWRQRQCDSPELEPLVIGRRSSEVELQIVDLLDRFAGDSPAPVGPQPAAAKPAAESPAKLETERDGDLDLLRAARHTLAALAPALQGTQRFGLQVAGRALEILERELAEGAAARAAETAALATVLRECDTETPSEEGLPALRERLCAALRDKAIAPQDAALRCALRRLAEAHLKIDNPGFAALPAHEAMPSPQPSKEPP